jgi:hypothetical protein
MKVYRQKPKKDVLIVATGEHEYEIYLMVPVLLGGCRWLGTQRVEDDSRRVFPNIDSVALSYLDAQGEAALSEEVHARMHARYEKKRDASKRARTPAVQKMTVEQLLAAGALDRFLALRKLDRAKQSLGTEFIIDASEAKQLGLTGRIK